MKATRKILALRVFIILMLCFLWGGNCAYAKMAWVKFDGVNTLTFYYGENRTLSENEYKLEYSGSPLGWGSKRDVVTKVVFDKTFAEARPTTCNTWFHKFEKLERIEGIENLNTSNVGDMTGMFHYCKKLTSLDLSNFNTEKVTNMKHMFASCEELTSLNISNFDTKNVTNMQSMFESCNKLTSLNLSNFDTKNVTNMNGMFYSCDEITSLDLSSFNTKNVKDMGAMFYTNEKLTTIYAGDKFILGNALNSSYMFGYCEKLVGDIAYDKNTVDATYAKVVGGYFKYVRPWVKYVDNTLTFQCSYKESFGDNEYALNTGYENPGWASNITSSIKKAVFDPSFAKALPTSCYKWFYNQNSNTAIDGLEYLDTEAVTNMSSMFQMCQHLTSLDLSNFNTSAVTNMSNMFDNCTRLTKLDLSNFNTSNVSNMSYMFNYCNRLTSLDISSFNTSKVLNMSYMFNYCSELTNLDVSSFNASVVKNVQSMFRACSALTSLDLSHFVTSTELSNMSTMFANCSSLQKIIISTFDYWSAHSSHNDMLYNCPATIYCPISEASKSSLFASNTMAPYVSINPNAEYGTLCVPINSTLDEGTFTGFDKLYTVKEYDSAEGKIKLQEATSIEPGVSYIYHHNPTDNDPVANAITFTIDVNNIIRSNPKNDGSFLKGTFERITAPGGSYILQTDGMFHPVAQGNTTIGVGAYRAYLDLGSNQDAKVFSLSFEDSETTDIKGISEDADGSAAKTYYDLMGRRVFSPVKGQVYIVNGKKVVYL